MHLGKKRYFLPLGMTPKTGVGFIAKKITVLDNAAIYGRFL